MQLETVSGWLELGVLVNRGSVEFEFFVFSGGSEVDVLEFEVASVLGYFGDIALSGGLDVEDEVSLNFGGGEGGLDAEDFAGGGGEEVRDFGKFGLGGFDLEFGGEAEEGGEFGGFLPQTCGLIFH